jgi:hypothetical protein
MHMHVIVAQRSVLGGTSLCYLEPKFTTFGPTSTLQSIQLAPAPAPLWITRNASDTPRNRSYQIGRKARRPRCRSERSTNTWCHRLRDAATKVDSFGGIELMHNYSPGRRSHHPNNAPQQKTLTLKTRLEQRSEVALPPATGPHAGGDPSTYMLWSVWCLCAEESAGIIFAK